MEEGTACVCPGWFVVDSRWLVVASAWFVVASGWFVAAVRRGSVSAVGAAFSQFGVCVAASKYGTLPVRMSLVSRTRFQSVCPLLMLLGLVQNNTHDIIQQLRSGNNTLAVLLGRGWWALPEDPFTAVRGTRQ